MIEGCKHGPKDFIPQPCVDCAREAAEEQERLAPLRRRARDLAAQVEQQEAVEHSSDPQPPSVSGLTRYINTTQLTATTWEIRIVEPDEPRREDDLVSLDEVDDAVARLTADNEELTRLKKTAKALRFEDVLKQDDSQLLKDLRLFELVTAANIDRLKAEAEVTRLRQERDALQEQNDKFRAQIAFNEGREEELESLRDAVCKWVGDGVEMAPFSAIVALAEAHADDSQSVDKLTSEVASLRATLAATEEKQ